MTIDAAANLAGNAGTQTDLGYDKMEAAGGATEAGDMMRLSVEAQQAFAKASILMDMATKSVKHYKESCKSATTNM